MKRLSYRERALNWLFQHLVYSNPHLDFSLHFTSRVTNAEGLVIGKDVERTLARNGGCYLEAMNGIEIGDYTIISAGVKIISANHDFTDFKDHIKASPIKIGRYCWLGANCVILPGVTLGERVVVGSGAVVSRSFPANTIIAGVPAKVLRKLDLPNLITSHKTSPKGS